MEEFDKGLILPIDNRIKENEDNINALFNSRRISHNKQLRELIDMELYYLKQINMLLHEISKYEK